MPTAFDSFTDLTVLGGPVRLYRAGDTGPPVLLLHGAMLDTAQGVWHDIVPQLAPDHRVHVIDMPRHGGSRPWTGMLADTFYTRFLLELLDELQLDRAVLMGLSMGAGVAHRFALAHPERVSALVAIEPGGVEARYPFQLLTWALQRLPGFMRLCTWMLARTPRLPCWSMGKSLTDGADTPGFERIIALALEEARAKDRHGEKALDDWQIDWFGPFEMCFHSIPELHRLSSPTLWVAGGLSRSIDKDAIAATHAATPNSRMLTIPDAGHIVPYDRPQQLGVAMREFLADVLPAGDIR